MRNGIIIFLIACLCFPLKGKAQEERVEIIQTEEITESADTIAVMAPDSVTQGVLTAADAEFKTLTPAKMAFKPDPNKAILLALVPGLGQVYNKAYWKLPLVYGAVLGCTYAITWNNRNYSDYRKAYIDIMSAHPEQNTSWLDFAPSSYQTFEEKLEWAKGYKENFKRRRDYFRRNRDLSIIISAGIYLISVLDAYVDAQLFDFDISPDLSMRIEPTVTPRTNSTPQSYGVNCSIKF